MGAHRLSLADASLQDKVCRARCTSVQALGAHGSAFLAHCSSKFFSAGRRSCTHTLRNVHFLCRGLPRDQRVVTPAVRTAARGSPPARIGQTRLVLSAAGALVRKLLRARVRASSPLWVLRPLLFHQAELLDTAMKPHMTTRGSSSPHCSTPPDTFVVAAHVWTL